MTEASRARSTELLLASMDPTGRAWEQAVQRPASEIDWPWVIECARAHKLIWMVATRTLESGIEDRLPEAAQIELESERERSLQHRAAVARTLAETRELLQGLDCPFLVVKGSVYAHDVYEHLTMRRFADIDVLIPPEKVDVVDRALRRSGYFFWAHPYVHEGLPRWFSRQAPPGEEPGSEDAARRILATFHKHYLYVLKKEDPRTHVEVHWHILRPGQGRVPTEDLWYETRTTKLEGVETLTLNWEASLLHAAVHAMEEPPTEQKLLHISDVAWMLWKWRKVIDTDKLRGLAQAWRLSGFLTAAVIVADMVLPLGLPEDSSRIWPHRSPIRKGLLSSAGFGPWILDRILPEGRWHRLAVEVGREGLWETALGRPPARAWERVNRAVGARVRWTQSRLRNSKETRE